MDTELVIHKAEKLLALGRGREARELLLQEGYVKQLHATIQEAYLNLIPESAECVREQQGSFKDLFDKNVAQRVNASSYIFKEARREFSASREWLGDPRMIDLLFKALQDNEVKVIENITGALWMISHGGRYNSDLRIYSKLLDLVTYDHSEIVRYAALGLQNYTLTSKYQILLAVLPKQTVSKTAKEILGNFYQITNRAEAKKVKHGLSEVYKQCKRKTIRGEIEKTLESLE